ncbi:unnamed protein product, partial [Meganyctiphanes norvegica]
MNQFWKTLSKHRDKNPDLEPAHLANLERAMEHLVPEQVAEVVFLENPLENLVPEPVAEVVNQEKAQDHRVHGHLGNQVHKVAGQEQDLFLISQSTNRSRNITFGGKLSLQEIRKILKFIQIINLIILLNLHLIYCISNTIVLIKATIW